MYEAVYKGNRLIFRSRVSFFNSGGLRRVVAEKDSGGLETLLGEKHKGEFS